MRADHTVELPIHDGGVEVGARGRGRQHRGAQTIGADPVVNVVCGGPNVGSALAAHPHVAMVSVTGSPRTGHAVARAAADRFARVHLELGGNAPVVICADADLETTVEQVAFAAFYNAGQDCTAASRVIAHEAVYDDVVQRFAEAPAARPSAR